MRQRVLAFLTIVGICLTGFSAHALDPTRALQQFHHTTWTNTQGMPGHISAIAQTPDGYLWLGTASGLYRFDGTRVEPFNHPLPGGSVLSLAVSSTGDLWIGSSMGLSRLSHGVLTSVPAPSSVPIKAAVFIATGRNGEVFVANTSQVARVDGRGWHIMGSDWGSSGIGFTRPGGVWGLAVARDGVVWAKNLLGLYYLRPGATAFVKAEGYGGAVIDFSRAPDGRLWTADTTLKHFYALPDLSPSGPPAPPLHMGAPLAPGVLGHSLLDHDGVLWVANSVTFGLYRVRSIMGPKASVEPFTSRDGLTDNLPDAVFEDHEGDIWVATAQGLDRFSPANVVTERGIKLQGRSPDISASPDAVYVAEGYGSVIPGGPNAVEHLYRIGKGAPERLPVSAIVSNVLNAAGDNGVLFGSGHPLFRISGKAQTIVPLPEELGDTTVRSAAERGSDLWVAVLGRGTFRRRGETWTRFLAPGVEKTAAPGLRFDQNGALWISGLVNGVMDRVTGDHVDEFDTAKGLDIDGATVFTPEQNGILVGSLLGVSWFDGSKFHHLQHDQAPYLTGITGIVEDDVGGTWVQTSNGIYRVATQQLRRAFFDAAVSLDAQLFDVHDGLTSTAALRYPGTAVRGPDGRLWFLNVSNLAWLDPHRLYRNLAPPPVAIRGITVNGHVYDNLGALRLPPGASNLQIDYTALSLQDPDRVRVRYRLEGVDKTWVDAGARREAFYTQLGPGRYRFQVIAANNDGVWNTTGATLQFRIPPTFVQTPVFMVLCMALVGLVVWIAYALRIRQISSAIQARLEERIDERERIARELHDTLLQGFQGLVLRLQGVMEGLPQDQPAQAELGLILTRADEVMTTGRKRVQDLRTVDLPGGLAAALSDAAETMAATSGTRFQLVVEGVPRGLHTVVGEELAAIGRQAISNAFQHARARTIDARLLYSRRSLTVRISDDGVGAAADILTAGRLGHFGLLGMRERADKIDAKLLVSRSAAGGVEVIISVAAGVAFATSPNSVGNLQALTDAVAGFLRRRRQAG